MKKSLNVPAQINFTVYNNGRLAAPTKLAMPAVRAAETGKRTSSRGVDEKSLNVPAQVKSIMMNNGRLALASRARRGG